MVEFWENNRDTLGFPKCHMPNRGSDHSPLSQCSLISIATDINRRTSKSRPRKERIRGQSQIFTLSLFSWGYKAHDVAMDESVPPKHQKFYNKSILKCIGRHHTTLHNYRKPVTVTTVMMASLCFYRNISERFQDAQRRITETGGCVRPVGLFPGSTKSCTDSYERHERLYYF